jgi:Big-like domain-containing protein
MKAAVTTAVSMRLLVVFLGVQATGIAACAHGGSPEKNGARNGLDIAADRVRYRAGQPLTLTIRNGREDTVSFNPCTRTLETQRDGKWVAVPEPARICTMEAWMLSPGSTRTGPTELPADLRAGRYRVVLGFGAGSGEPPAERLEARTPPFSVDR